jgi:hypothetical protein
MKYVVKVYDALELSNDFDGVMAGEELVEKYPFFKSLIEEPEFLSASVRVGFAQYIVTIEKPVPEKFTPIMQMNSVQPLGLIDPFIGHRTEANYKHPRPSDTDNRDRRG